MIFQYAFLVPSKEDLLDRTVEILRSEYGLVDADPSKMMSTIRHIPTNMEKYPQLVWEDEAGVGRYRVKMAREKKTIDGINHDLFMFQYWINPKKASKEVWEKDPMKEVIQRIWQEAKKPIEFGIKIENTVEEMYKDIMNQ